MNETQKPWEGLDIPDEMKAQRSYPTVQWINRGGDVTPPQTGGGFFAAEKYGNEPLPNGVEVQFHNDKGTFSQSFSAAILAIRWGWFSHDQRTGMSTRLEKYADKSRKRVQVIMLLKNDDGKIVGPVKLTVVGLANREIQQAYWALNTVACAAQAQPWMFWLQFSAGDTMEVGDHKQRMTPVLVSSLLPDGLTEAFIGSDAVKMVVEMSHEIAEWRDAWRSPTKIDDESEGGNGNNQDIPDDPPEIAKAKLTVVKTAKYGELTIDELLGKDAEYAWSLLKFIDEHRDQYMPSQIDAALELIAYADGDQLPF